MPTFIYKCINETCNNEFEKIVPSKAAKYKWCNYCDRLTQWFMLNCDEYGKQLVCNDCLGNSIVKSMAPEDLEGPSDIEENKEVCPICGGISNHILKYDKYGKEQVNHSSLRFNFNYIPSSEQE